MPLILLLIIAAIIGGTWLLNTYIAPPGARTVLKLVHGKLTVTRGSLSAQTQTYVQDVLRDAGLEQGSVAILANGRLWFSPSIPDTAHQQLRNLLMR
jgi:hypothetical protein